MSEFGASGDPSLLHTLTADANEQFLGWTFWAWKYFDDPTGSSDEALVDANGQLKPTAPAWCRPIPRPSPERPSR